MHSTCANSLGWNDDEGKNSRFHLMDLHIFLWVWFLDFSTDFAKLRVFVSRAELIRISIFLLIMELADKVTNS